MVYLNITLCRQIWMAIAVMCELYNIFLLLCNSLPAKLSQLCRMKNIKQLMLSILALSSAAVMNGQTTDASFMIDKVNQHAVMISLNQTEEMASDALQLRLERSGLKKKMRRGIVRYQEVVLSEISPEKIDIYTKIEKGPNNSSIVYMAVSKGYNNFANSTDDTLINKNVKAYLESLVMYTDSFSDDIDITVLVKDLGKEEKDLEKLMDEQKDLQKQKMSVENRLRELDQEIKNKGELISKSKSALEAARVKRNNPVNR